MSEKTPPTNQSYEVKGTVRLSDGSPAVGIKVFAFDRDLRTEQLLGQSQTKRDGSYLIQSNADAFSEAETGSADLVVKAFAANGSLLAASRVLFNAPPSAIVDVTIPAEVLQPSTLFEKIEQSLEPLLGRFKTEELEEDKQHQDLSFLASETGFDKTVLARFVVAHKLARRSLQAEFWFVLLGGSFYQFSENQSLKEQLAAILDSLSSLDAAAVRKALARGFNEKEVPESFQKKVGVWVEAFLQFVASRHVADGTKPTFVKSVLEHAGIKNNKKQEKFARLFNEYKALTPDLLKRLARDRSFKKSEIANVRTSFELADLTRGDFSVVKAIKEKFKVRQPDQIQTLARHPEEDWVRLIKAKHAAGELTLPFEVGELVGRSKFSAAEVYGKTLARQFREAFPTMAFAGGLRRAMENGGPRGLRQGRALTGFLRRHRDFDLLKSSVDDFLKTRMVAADRSLQRNDGFRLELKAVQRVFKLAPTFEATDALLADNLHSAQQIYRLGQSEFVRRYAGKAGFTAESARLTWNRAADIHAAVVTIVADLTALDAEGLPAVLKNDNAALSTFSNWNNLFKAGDLCECEHCRSVLGPAAYFADLLMFLKDRKSAKPGLTVKDILFGRRPDLGYIELNCAYALTPFPYIDTVCEVLQDAVDNTDENDLELVGFNTIPTGPGAKAAVPAAFENAFADSINNGKEQISLGADFSLSQASPSDPDRWVVHGDDVTYLLKKKAPSPNFFAEILRNTKAGAAELRAYPQYVNPKAYEKLRVAKYPMALPLDLFPEGDARRLEQRARCFALPFDLFAEEVRSGFKKCNLQRWDLMRILRGNAPPNNPTDGEIAAEYFGISVDPAAAFDEKRLILVADSTVAGQQTVWGEIGNADWLATVTRVSDPKLPNTLGNVKTFLQKTGLEYNELLTLLDLKFINPASDIIVHHLDPSCDTDKKVIQALDPAKLDRIHRFLRLWRKLRDWKMWELDLVIRHPSIGNGALDEPLLVNLFYFCRLKERLGGKATVEQLCALFSNLNTESHFTKLYEKREDAHYQSLFVNRRLINPLDPAFQLDPVTGDLPTGDTITAHHPVVLAALGIREADLVVFKELTKSDGITRYITDHLTLSNLSFLWRHASLAKLLKFKTDEWKTILKLFQRDILEFADPKTAWEFVEQIDRLKGTSFSPDELNWLLAADRSAKAAIKETDAARFLTGLRKDLQAIQAEYDPAQYAFLSPPRDVENLTALLTSLLQKLKRDETETDLFLKTLRGPVLLEADVQGLAAGFAFPAAITGAPNHIPIRYRRVLRFAGSMTAAQRNTLLTDASLAAVTGLSSYQNAIQDLFEQAGQATVTGLPAGFTFPAVITGAPNHIPIRLESVLRFNGAMTDAQRTVLLSGPLPPAVTGNISYRSAIEALFQQSASARDNFVSVEVDATLPGGVTLPTDRPSLPIGYNSTTQKLSFIGVITNAERLALNAAGNPATAVDELFRMPRLAIKFFEPVFTAPLKTLPSVIDFKAQLSAGLAAKISCDREEELLRFAGIMTNAEQAALNALVPNVLPSDVAYHIAVNSLASQPQTIASPDDRIWLTESDIDPTLPANNTLAKRLATAAGKGLGYLSKSLAANTVVQQSSAQLGLTEALTRHLLTQYTFPAFRFDGSMSAAQQTVLLSDPSLASVSGLASYQQAIEQLFQGARQVWVTGLPAGFAFPSTITNAPNHIPIRYEPIALLRHLTGVFAGTSGAMNYPSRKTTFDGWFWANRAAAILKKWKVTVAEFKKVIALTAGAQLLDFLTLPLDDSAPIASMERFLRTSRLLRLRDILPETKITFLEVLEKLAAGAYATAANFAADVELMNEAWHATDVEALAASLDLAYPTEYLLAESWERLRRAFYFLNSLNAGAEAVKTFAAAAMTNTHAKTVKELLRGKFGTETWLTLSAEIQDALRERKRDALAGYLLAQPQPADAPSGKWENTKDLYAYYLLDVEMTSCQLTSRLVQGSGSVQLFVQRCFMGLEPNVIVKADGDDGDSAWRWWKWMCKYRVWEANRKVFLWPENWIEPELKKDRSQFFKDLESELLQNEINQYTVETAFTNYLEKLDGVAQLEIAGFYQEDDGDDAIIHVFCRTKGTEPHLYYYRRYDYRQWTPWEKVDLEIQGDYLIPAVLDKWVFLFWPVFTEVPDEAANSTVSTPGANQSVSVPKTWKRLRLQMAVSTYRQGKWTPKRVSKDFDQNAFAYNASDVIHNQYRFFLVDRSDIDGRVGVSYGGSSNPSRMPPPAVFPPLIYPYMAGAFEIVGCKGLPELANLPGNFKHAIRPELASTGPETAFLKWVELVARGDYPQNDFSLENAFVYQGETLRFTPVLMQTPGIFRMSPPWHLSYLDKMLLDGFLALGFERANEMPTPAGTWLPFFYSDKKRTFFVLPSLWQAPIEGAQDGSRMYYPDIKKEVRQWEDYYKGQVQTSVDNFPLSALAPAQRQQLEQLLHQRLPEEVLPPYTDEQVKNLMKRFLMRYFHFYLGTQSLKLFQDRLFHFKNFYHPFVCDFAKLVYNPLKGIPALMSRETQLKNSGFSFNQSYRPTPWVVEPTTENYYPNEIVDFAPDGAYSPYNWELFFHAPLLIANSLSKNQRFEEARNWYHFIFNPIGTESSIQGGSAMSKYWITKPFFETTDPQYVQQRIDNILRMLAGDTSVPGYSAQAKKELEDQVLDWRTNPFEPHRIANYRTVAYQKTVVIKYLDNLIAWGDYLFRQDSMESINEATQLYIMGAEILGPRPKTIPPQANPPLESFNELEHEFDNFSNALVEMENLIPQPSANGAESSDPAPLPMLYFCIPQNDKMLSYWDTVADRLFKIRHCMNIEGVVRQLDLFERAIEPGSFVKAVAAGVDISSALADLNAPLPLYRFNVLLQKANELCNDVKALGAALLSAVEKKDGEALSLLRQDQEIRVLEAVKVVREKQIEEAKENLAGLKKSKELAQTRKQYYESREFMNVAEAVALGLSYESAVLSVAIQLASALAGTTRVSVPQFTTGGAGFGGSPVATITHGGQTLGDAQEDASNVLSVIAMAMEKAAAITGAIAGYQRRKEEWDFQKDLAAKEIEQTDRSITAAELRIAIAEKELENHVLQIENARAIDEFMRSKYTSEELYQWQVGQISDVYFQSYQLAYDLAKGAERCFRFELGLQDSSYIQFGYWDSLKKGLLSGEKLQYDLRRLESAYLERNRREFELTKSISLLLLDPLALVKLRETGRCFIRLPEEIFDLDYPGHYFRRIKSVSITLPCVVGPYTTVSCTLRLLKNSIRINTASGDNGHPRNTDDQGLPTDDDRFVENNIPVKAIAASHGQNDSGVFELSFRDERYLPFEGAGVISDWSLELFSDVPSNNPDPANPDFGKPLRQFDYSTISDAILHLKYTAREDAGPFKNAVIAHLREYFSPGDGATPAVRMFNLRHEFPSQWHRFLNPINPADGNVFTLEMSSSLFRILDQEKTLRVNTISLLARCTDSGNYSAELTLIPPPPSPPVGPQMFTLVRVNEYGGLHFAQNDISAQPIDIVPGEPPIKWQFKMTGPSGNLNPDPPETGDLMLILGYQWE
jgi:Tc toxin complex TcA C-terminal TcB-binding domain/Neuraminidase-like domain